MAAYDFWSAEYVRNLTEQINPAFGSGGFYNVKSGVDRVVVCGDIRRNPDAKKVKHLCFVVVGTEGANLVDLRARISANVKAIWPGAVVKSFKVYDYTALPDDSGSVSWIVVDPAYAGAATVHATGPVILCQMIDMFAEKRGMKFGASGLKQGDVKLATPDEETFFHALGAKFIPVAERESVRYLEPFGA